MSDNDKHPMEATIEALGRLKGRLSELEDTVKKQSEIIAGQEKSITRCNEFLSNAFKGGSTRFEAFLAALDEQVAKETRQSKEMVTTAPAQVGEEEDPETPKAEEETNAA